jgi:hypothetical protein
VRQYARHGVVGFLARYVTDYVRGRIRGLTHREAYLAIPFEVEARERCRTSRSPRDAT